MRKLAILIGLAALAAGTWAQGGPPPGRGFGPGPRFLGFEPGMPGRVVTNAPYSADIVTDSTQTLPDGNRIHQTATSHVYRDSQGRTRREQSLEGLQSVVPGAKLPPVVVINDPVAGANYTLNPDRKTASKSTFMRPGGRGGRAGGQTDTAMRAPQGMSKRYARGGQGAQQNVKTESLGRQMIEGVAADGTRTTMTIPAGQMGNELAIVVVTERWYSPDLQTVVLSRRTDPRSGEVVTRLANISRGEPSPSLFEVPPDYKVETAGRGPRPR